MSSVDRDACTAWLDRLERGVTGRKVLVWGDLMLDRYIEGTCRRVSPEAPVPVVEISAEHTHLGGAGNVVANLCCLGVEVLPVGLLGDDEDGRRLHVKLSRHGCDTQCLTIATDRPTTCKTRVTAQGQQLVRFDREQVEPPSAFVAGRLRRQVMESLSGVDLCVLSDYGKGACPAALVAEVIAAAARQGVPVVVDPKGTDYARYRGALCVKPNLPETELVAGERISSSEKLATLAQRLRTELETQCLLITRGSQGMTLVTVGETVHIPAAGREVFDVSGAGDTVIATLAAALLAGLGFEAAARLGNLAAGIAVSRAGTAVVSLAQMRARLGGQAAMSCRESDSCATRRIPQTGQEQSYDLVEGHPGSVEYADDMQQTARVG